MQLLALLFTTLAAAEYILQSNFTGPAFLDSFDFYTSWDPTFGYVHYVDRATAEQYGMINVSAAGGPTIFGAEHTQVLDPDANLGRLSLRLSTKQSWTQGLFIADMAHMPGTACGLWPAFWSLGTGSDPWPAYGEVDIIEYPNLATKNLMALHTKEGCSVAGSDQSGTVLTNDCGKDLGVAGCYSSPTKPNSAGTDFNANGGGVYAMEWTSSAIKIWFFPRDQIPANLNGPTPPDPTTFGVPDANFAGGCDIDKYFFNHSLIFNIEFCGSWAGPTFVDDGCPALDPTNQWRSCNIYAATNPQAYAEAYWAVNYLEVFTSAPGSPSPTSSLLSTVTPAASTTSVTDSGALGAPTTPTQSLWPPKSISTSSTSSPSSSSPPPRSSPITTWSGSISASSPPSPPATPSSSSFSTPISSTFSSISPSLPTASSASSGSTSTRPTSPSSLSASSSTTSSEHQSLPSSIVPQIITIRTSTIVSVPASHPPQKRQPTGPPPGIGGALRPSHTTESFSPEDPEETPIPASWTFECCFEYAPLPTKKATTSRKQIDDEDRSLPTAHSKMLA